MKKTMLLFLGLSAPSPMLATGSAREVFVEKIASYQDGRVHKAEKFLELMEGVHQHFGSDQDSNSAFIDTSGLPISPEEIQEEIKNAPLNEKMHTFRYQINLPELKKSFIVAFQLDLDAHNIFISFYDQPILHIYDNYKPEGWEQDPTQFFLDRFWEHLDKYTRD